VFDVLAVAVACSRPVFRVSPAPPAPIVARTGCGTYEIESDGTVHPYRRNWAPVWVPGAVSHPSPGVWVSHPGGRLAVYRARSLLWQSHIRVPSDDVAVGRSSLAFAIWGPPESATPTLWMARVGRREFRVARREDAIGWTAGGLVTQHGNRIRVRSPDGMLLRTVSVGHGPAYDNGDHTVVFVRADGTLVRTDGRHSWPLRRGFTRGAWVTVLANRVLQVMEPRHTFYLRSNGTVVGGGPPLSENVTGLPDESVAYVAGENRKGSSPGVNVVFLLDAAGRTHRLYTRRVPRLSCGEYTAVTYARHRLLYVDDEGPIAILDPSGRQRPIDLTRALNVLQPKRASMRQLSADWLANWN